MTRYRVIWNRAVTVTAAEFIKEFDGEWADAQQRGLTEDEFAVECIRECDFETLVDLGSDETRDFEWEPA